MNWLLKRLSEPTTYLGLAASTFGLGQAFKIDEAPAVAQAIGAAGQAVQQGVDPWTAGILALGGILGAVLGEKGRR